MASKKIVHKPITHKEYEKLYGYHPLTDLFLQTGARRAEVKRVIEHFWKNGKSDYVDIKTKMSGTKTNRIYLTQHAIESIEKLEYYIGKDVRTFDRHILKISKEVGVKFTGHNLRATFGTRLSEMGVDIITVSTLMNHSDISITAQYISFSEVKLRQGLNLLEEYNSIGGYTHEELLEELYKRNIKIELLEREVVKLRKQLKKAKGE